jgi:hypothetical protein
LECSTVLCQEFLLDLKKFRHASHRRSGIDR